MAQSIKTLILDSDEYALSLGLEQQPKRSTYVVKEYEDISVTASELIVNGELQIYDEVGKGDYFTVRRKKGRLVFQSGGFIGLIPINDHVVLDVRPRVPLKNLERMMRIAEDTPQDFSPFLRHYGAHEEVPPSMIDLFAQGLVNAIRDIEANGLHREYIQRTEDTSFPRGRVMLGETMRRHEALGIKHKVTAAWFEHTVDTAPNRCLKFTLWYLADHYKATGQSRGGLFQRIERAYHLFSGVKLDRSLKFLDDRIVLNPETLPSIRAYYRPALYIALTILRNRGISFAERKGDILMPSLLIDLKDTFEYYMRNVLRAKFRDVEEYVHVLDGNNEGTDGGAKLLFDAAPSTKANPDIVFRSENPKEGIPQYPLLLDAKYKKYVNKPDRAEIEQIVTYGASYRAPAVVIVHPRVNEPVHGLKHLGSIKPLNVYQYAFDLAADDPELEEEKFAAEMRKLLPATF